MSRRPNARLSVRRSALFMTLLGALGATAGAQWAQFGGPRRDFKPDSTGLAEKWPADGPRKLWSRPLGDGYSSIAVVDGVLYTMYRDGDDEVAVALEAQGGKTLWEYKYAAPFNDKMNMECGPGPHATPSVDGDHVYTIGVTVKLHCLDKKTGKVLWMHDLVSEFNASCMYRGYTCSPTVYKDLVIILCGGKGPSLLAFKQADGALAWKAGTFGIGCASPFVVNFEGEDLLIAMLSQEVAGFDPHTGDLKWSHPHPTNGGNISTPAWGDDHILFCSSAYDTGARAIQVKRDNGKYATDELWYNRKVMRVHHGNVVRVGDYVYGSTGDFGPAFIVCQNVKTGAVGWRERGFEKATYLYADNKLIILDQEGQLALAKVSPEKLEILSQCQVTEHVSWTVPTLIGKTLYIRDRKSIMALDLG
jgi:outer membrane protein assembly factor BamB